MPSDNVKDRINEFRREISSANEGSDLHWLIKKVAHRLHKSNPHYDDLKCWYEAQDRLLLYTQTQPIGSNINFSEYCLDCWRYAAWTSDRNLDRALEFYPYISVDRDKERTEQFIRAEESTADNVVIFSGTEKIRRGLADFKLPIIKSDIYKEGWHY
jgi:hypothetical protein